MDKREEKIVCERFIKMCVESLPPHDFEYLENSILPALRRSRYIPIKNARDLPIDGDGCISEQSFIDYLGTPSHNYFCVDCCGIFDWIKNGELCCNECGIPLKVVIEITCEAYETKIKELEGK